MTTTTRPQDVAATLRRGSVVMRVRGYAYRAGEEHVTACYVCQNGSLSHNRGDARIYASEGEAWDHAIASGLTGDDEAGPYCWTEEIAP